MAKKTTQRSIVLAAIVAAIVLLLVWRAPGVTSVILGGFIVAYVCAPLVDRLARRLPRSAATSIVMAGSAVALLAFFLMLVPVIAGQWQMLAEHLPQAVHSVQALVPRLETTFDIDLPETRSDLVDRVRQTLTSSGGALASALGKFAQRAFGGAAGVFGTVLNLVILVPIVGFYLLMSYHDIWPWVLQVVPAERRTRVLAIKGEIDGALGGFVRGQLTVALLIGIIQAIGYSLVGIPGGIVLGLVNGFLNMIPMVGAIFGSTLALVAAALQFAGWWPIIGAVIVLAVSGVLEQTVITPRIIGNKVGLPPMAVMLAALTGGELFGLVGMLLAVPAAATVKVMLAHLAASAMEDGAGAQTVPATPAGQVDPQPHRRESPP